MVFPSHNPVYFIKSNSNSVAVASIKLLLVAGCYYKYNHKCFLLTQERVEWL